MQADSSVALINANYNSSLGQLKNSTSSDTNDVLLKEQTDKFEAFFLKQILDIALNSEEGDDEKSLFPKDAGDKIYKSMYNDTMSSALSGNLGLSEMLYNYLKEGR
jgi:peptidoglycan hydrolase FlgJ